MPFSYKSKKSKNASKASKGSRHHKNIKRNKLTNNNMRKMRKMRTMRGGTRVWIIFDGKISPARGHQEGAFNEVQNIQNGHPPIYSTKEGDSYKFTYPGDFYLQLTNTESVYIYETFRGDEKHNKTLISDDEELLKDIMKYLKPINKNNKTNNINLKINNSLRDLESKKRIMSKKTLPLQLPLPILPKFSSLSSVISTPDMNLKEAKIYNYYMSDKIPFINKSPQDKQALFHYLILAIECGTDMCYSIFKRYLDEDVNNELLTLFKSSRIGYTLQEIAKFHSKKSEKFINLIEEKLRSKQSGSVPRGSVPYGSVPYGSVPHGSVPYGSLPSGSVPSSSVPSSSMVPSKLTKFNSKKPDSKDLKEIGKTIYNIYDKGYEFPIWILNDDWNTYDLADTTVFYFNNDDNVEDEFLTNVKTMTIEREPCNIALTRHYNKSKLITQFGWEEGAYVKRQSNGDLMPNIAIYTKAKVNYDNIQLNDIHVINLVGYAFDVQDQEDYIFFSRLPLEERQGELIKRYTNMWLLAYASAQRLIAKGNKITHFRLFNVGGSAFVTCLEILLDLDKINLLDYFKKNIFEPSFHIVRQLFANLKIIILEFEAGYFIPHSLNTTDKSINKTTLYVNAWDPWTLIGNGNKRDHSLDGFWGRSTNMSILGWGLTNPFMSFVRVFSNEGKIKLHNKGQLLLPK